MGTSEHGSLYNFLVDTSEHPDKLDAYRADPETAMSDANLSEQQKDALRSGERQRVEDALKDEGLSESAPFFCALMD
jgi:hypothetical protein